MRLLTCHLFSVVLSVVKWESPLYPFHVVLRGRVPGAWNKGQAVHGREPPAQPLRARRALGLVRNKRGRSENAMRAIEDAILKPALS
jgi:hypothetical protein